MIKEHIGMDFVIDKLTNSIENTYTGDRFQTEISFLSLNEIKLMIIETPAAYRLIDRYFKQ